jgi:hypothetical protein
MELFHGWKMDARNKFGIQHLMCEDNFVWVVSQQLLWYARIFRKTMDPVFFICFLITTGAVGFLLL